MATYDSKFLLTAVKAFARANSYPIDSTSVWEDYDSAAVYATQANAYAGQIITALVDGEYVAYILQPSESGYTLSSLAAGTSFSSTQYVVVGTRPESGQEQGVIYIEDQTGYIWNGEEWLEIFSDVSSSIEDFESRIGTLEDTVASKADSENAVFTGTLTLNEENVATESYVTSMLAQMSNGVPGIVDDENPLPTSDYSAGQMWRVASAGTYAGQVCEVGDLILCLADYDETSVSSDDFMVIQGNLDGSVTGPETATDLNVVVFDGTTGKVIADSNVSIASVSDAIAKAHEHSNLETLETYTQTQDELLATAESAAQTLVDTLSSSVDDALALKADADSVYTKTEIDSTISTIETNLNTKLDSDAVDAKIENASDALTEAYTEAISTAVGEIPENYDVYTYIQAVLSTGSTETTDALSDILQQANAYTDEAIEEALTVVEF